ncbi:uncharacterized protein G2W53_024532 [Senna tora]|uniref:Uncharacterized protein n=1 Tax=Senna tora TaxID=362788 RepID=A0A834TDP6_9FABA|nr:uncharacterized protein G2W53_024532 [Senna tora]
MGERGRSFEERGKRRSWRKDRDSY